MKHRNNARMGLLISIVIFVIAIILLITADSTPIYILSGILIVLSSIINFLMCRCPHCGSYISMNIFMMYCPYCSKSLDTPRSK